MEKSETNHGVENAVVMVNYVYKMSTKTLENLKNTWNRWNIYTIYADKQTL